MANHPFDEKAATWDDDPTRIERAAKVARAIAARVPLTTSMRALDFGCGTGLLGFHLLPWVGHVTFVDPSQGMRAQVETKLSAFGADRGRVLAPEAPEIAAPRGYDLVATLMALHHIPDTLRALATLVSLIAPGGWLALADLDLEDGSFHGDDDTSVHHGFDRSTLRALLEDLGLQDLQDSTVFEVERLAQDEPRRYPVFLITGRLQSKKP